MILIFGVVFLLCLGLSIAFLFSGSNKKELVLPDGTRLRFEGFGFKGTNQAVRGTPFSRMMLRVFPEGLTVGSFRWKPPEFSPMNFGESLVLWFRASQTMNANSFRMVAATVRDGTGMEWTTFGSFFPVPGMNPTPSSTNKSPMVALMVQSFPRQGSELRVKLATMQTMRYMGTESFDPSKPLKLVGEVRMPNPNSNTGQKKSPAPFPATVKNDSLEVTIKDWRSLRPQPASNLLFFGGSAANQFVDFEVKPNEKTGKSYSVALFKATDYSGNPIQVPIIPANPSVPLRPSNSGSSFHSDFDPRGPLDVEIVLHQTNQFSADQLYRFENLKIPKPGGLQEAFRTNILGMNCRITVNPTMLNIHLNPVASPVDANPSGFMISLQEISASSGEVKRRSIPFGAQPNHASFPIELPKEAETFSFSLAFSPPVTAHFTVQPRIVEKLNAP